MLKKLRTSLAIIFLLLITLMFLDISGNLVWKLGWLAKIQFLPAVFALNVGVIIALILLTVICGRIYCSVICPMGVFQDVVSWIHSKFSKNRFSYKPAATKTRLIVMVLFAACTIIGVNAVVGLLAPYSAYGRMVTSIIQPVWIWGNNLLAGWSESQGNYIFSEHDLWLKSLPVTIVAVATFIVITITAWRSGRGYCNTICPVGTVLGYLSKYALLRPVIDTTKCNSCGLCAKKLQVALHQS